MIIGPVLLELGVQPQVYLRRVLPGDNVAHAAVMVRGAGVRLLQAAV